MQQYGEHMSSMYDIVEKWGGFARAHTPSLVDFYEKKGLNGPILDLCSGTGTSSLPFLKLGSNVVLIDHSPSMLEKARTKLYYYILKNRATLIEADVTDFSVEGFDSFGFAFALYDAMNHLKNRDALSKCFARVYASLKNHGYFIFDMNTRLGLELSNKMEFFDNQEVFVSERGIYSNGMDTAYIKITGFIKTESGNYERFDETLYNRSYEMLEIRSMLLETGFSNVHFSRIENLEVPIENPEKQPRVFFVCQK
ncbi:class I SAM-dependent methyltransferase [Paenibacillus sp. 2TAF8]|uniref:class I SAM-dependent DNA methyltransferase n=1 Tax=Paenibacillus sp. 2TAF8 TaxID=3233020 RepID=UPI003F9466C7